VRSKALVSNLKKHQMSDGSFEPYKTAAAASIPVYKNPKNLNPKQDMVFLSKHRFVLITSGHQESYNQNKLAKH
jgi:hypothetical protein